MGPRITENNFDAVSKSGIKDPNTQKVSIGQTASLKCTGGSTSRPFILWMHQPSPGNIVNASCGGGARSTEVVGNNNAVLVFSLNKINY